MVTNKQITLINSDLITSPYLIMCCNCCAGLLLTHNKCQNSHTNIHIHTKRNKTSTDKERSTQHIESRETHRHHCTDVHIHTTSTDELHTTTLPLHCGKGRELHTTQHYHNKHRQSRKKEQSNGETM